MSYTPPIPIIPITLEQELKIKELYKLGYSQRYIEKETNITRDRFRKFFISPNNLQ